MGLRSFALLASFAALPALAQQSPPPMNRAPMVVPNNSEAARSLEEQRATFEVYQKCIADHRKEVELHYAAAEVIQIRERRPMIEAALASDPRVRAQYPGGVDQLATLAFARYKAAGGTASSAAQVQPEPTPCPTPGPRLPR